MLSLPASIPSPAEGEWFLGPLPIRAYAIAIGIGIVLAWWVLERRYTAKGGPREVSIDVALWMVLLGILGARVYHVVSSPEPYFGQAGDISRIIEIWNGGLGIWGAVPAGALGAWLALRRRGLRLAPFADALAPGLLIGQAVGRLGNYFNQELYGAPTELPWGLEIDAPYRVAGYTEPGMLFHPTFLYEMLWSLAMVGVLLWAERRFQLRHGRVMWLYVMLYTAGRGWIEYLRIDAAETVLGVRLNIWTAGIVFLLALYFFVRIGRATRNKPEEIWLPGHGPGDTEQESNDAETTSGQDEAGGETATQPGEESASPPGDDNAAPPGDGAERGSGEESPRA